MVCCRAVSMAVLVARVRMWPGSGPAWLRPTKQGQWRVPLSPSPYLNYPHSCLSLLLPSCSVFSPVGRLLTGSHKGFCGTEEQESLAVCASVCFKSLLQLQRCVGTRTLQQLSRGHPGCVTRSRCAVETCLAHQSPPSESCPPALGAQ